MTASRSICAPALLWAWLAACRGGGSGLPTWEETAPPDDDGSRPAERDGEAPDAAAPEPTSAAAGDRAAPTSGTEPAVPDAEPGAAPASAALPPPLHDRADRKCGKDPGVGMRLRPFELRSPDGKPISTATYRGRVLLVNFWGTWCKPCLQELPEFDQLYRRYRGNGLTLLAIATDEDPAPVKDFLNGRRIAAKVALGGEAYASQYGSDKFPFSFVVDHEGVVRGSYRGYKPECLGQLERDLRTALERRTPR